MLDVLRNSRLFTWFQADKVDRDSQTPDRVLVVGATGGVGQLVVAQLLQQEYRVRVLARDAAKVERLFSDQVEVTIGNLLQPETLSSALRQVTVVICCTGTTAFPSARWEFNLPDDRGLLTKLTTGFKIYTNRTYREQMAQNSPARVDGEGVMNLVKAIVTKGMQKRLKRFVLVSSCGIMRRKQFPFSVLNLYGVLDAKFQAEESVIQSDLPYTIFRPGRLIDGPYTSYDLNTLLKAKTEGKLGVVLDRGDRLSGQASRIDVAALCVECLRRETTQGQVFEVINRGPRSGAIEWPT